MDQSALRAHQIHSMFGSYREFPEAPLRFLRLLYLHYDHEKLDELKRTPIVLYLYTWYKNVIHRLCCNNYLRIIIYQSYRI